MAKQTYVIIGATGQIGHVIVQHLVKKGHQVRALGRNQNKLNDLKNMGAEVYLVENLEKESSYTKAFEGAEGAFLMIPPGYNENDLGLYQDKIGETLARVAQRSTLSHIVNLSSLGAHLSEGVGPIKGLHRQEKRLEQLEKRAIIHLRPSYFMENLLWSIPNLNKTGFFKGPLDPELAIPMVATEDVGIKAAECLESLQFKGKTSYEFVGPRPVTMPEVARVIGLSIGKPNLKYVQQSYDEIRKEMAANGFKPKVIDLMVEMYMGFNQGKCLPTEQLTPDQRGKTTIEQFATQTFAKAFNAQHVLH